MTTVISIKSRGLKLKIPPGHYVRRFLVVMGSVIIMLGLVALADSIAYF
jgi:hypothetical protein